MNKLLTALLLLSSILLLTLTLPILSLKFVGGNEQSTRLVLFVDRTLQEPIEELASSFEKQVESWGKSVEVSVVYGSSGYVLSQLEMLGRGDLYVSDDVHFALIGVEKGLLDNSSLAVVGYVKLGLVILSGNPKDVTSIADALSRSDVKIALGNPEHVSAGILARKVMEKWRLWSQVEEGVREGRVFYAESAAKAASYVRMGIADVAVTFTIFAYRYDDLEVLEDPILGETVAPVIVALPTNRGALAEDFYSYVLNNREVFYKYGVAGVEGS